MVVVVVVVMAMVAMVAVVVVIVVVACMRSHRTRREVDPAPSRARPRACAPRTERTASIGLSTNARRARRRRYLHHRMKGKCESGAQKTIGTVVQVALLPGKREFTEAPPKSTSS